MICLQDGHHCGCHTSEFCVIRKPPNNHQPKTELGKRLIDLRAKAVAEGMPIEEHKPTLAEIERLVDAHKAAILNFERDNCKYYRDKETAARAALIAAYQRLGVK